MRSHGSVAKSVRLRKERTPEYYCPEKDCLFRTYNGQTDTFTPCQRHGKLHPDAIKKEDGINV